MVKNTQQPKSNSRRDFVKKSAYLAPAILTLQAVSSVAKAGSLPQPVRGDRARIGSE
jgi:hypothetical protein